MDTDDTDDDSIGPEQHTRDLIRVSEGATVTLVTHDGDEIRATCTGQQTHHDDSGVNIIEQNIARFVRERDGKTLIATLTDGLRGRESVPEFPWYTRLAVEARLPDHPDDDAPPGTYLGYVAEVRET